MKYRYDGNHTRKGGLMGTDKQRRFAMKHFIFILFFFIFVTSALGVEPVSAGTGATYTTYTDNENNSYTGSADGDMDRTMSSWYSRYPIEFNINADRLPGENAVLAVYAFDVDEESGEIDRVYFNGTEIGHLSGNNQIWNTTVLNVPRHLVKKGKNTVKITVSSGWVVNIDWAQLVLDGGQAEKAYTSQIKITGFDILDSEVKVYVDVDVQAMKTGTYKIEANLVGPSGDNEDTVFDTVSVSGGQNTAIHKILRMSKGSESGSYSINAFLFDTSTNILESVDSISFGHIKNVGPGAKVSSSLSNYELTAEDVYINLTAEPFVESIPVAGIYSPDDVFHEASELQYRAGSNGNYTFRIQMANGAEMTENVAVKNIDKEKSLITLNGDADIEILEESPYTDEGAMVSDNMDNTVSERLLSSGKVDTLIPGDYSISYDVSDTAGNIADTVTRTVHVLNRSLSVQTDAPQKSEGSVSLKGHIKYLGDSPISEHGLVWGQLPYPTVDFNTGKQTMGSIDSKEQFMHTVTGLEEGASYYVRAYAINEKGLLYGNQVEFINNGKNYGVLEFETESCNIGENAGQAVLRVVRTDGTEGNAAVDYKIYDGSGEPSINTLSFAEGEDSKTISIPVDNNNDFNGDREIYIKLLNPINATMGSKITARLTVNDDETAPLLSTNNLLINGDASSGTANWYSYSGWSPLKLKYGHFYHNGDDPATDCTGLEQAIDLTAYSSLIDAGQMYFGSQTDYATEDGEDSRLIIYLEDQNHSRYTAVNNDGNRSTSWSKIKINVDGEAHVLSNNSACKIQPSARKAWVKIEGKNTKSFADVDVWFDNVIFKIADREVPRLQKVYGDSGIYAIGDTIYIRLKFNEAVEVGGAPKLKLNLDGDKYASYLSGSGSDTLVLTYQVQAGDNTADLNYYAGNSLEGTIRDLADNAAVNPSLPDPGSENSLSGQADISIDGIAPTVAFLPDGSGENYARLHTTVITVSENDGIEPRYAWSSDSEKLPLSGWKKFNSGDSISLEAVDGDWYLHVYAADSNRNVNHAVSNAFKLDNIPPELSLSLSTEEWTNNTVNINVSASNHIDAIQTPDGNWTSADSLSYPVTEVGEYSFNVRDILGMTNTAKIKVSNIENTAPAITLLPNGTAGEGWESSAQSIISVSDDDSGIDKIYYQWTNSKTLPDAGWAACANGDVVEKNDGGEWYLHVKSLDLAGNDSFESSSVFRVDNTSPVLNLSTSAGSEWTDTEVIISAQAQKDSGSALRYLKLPDENDSKILADGSNLLNHDFTASQNGSYIFEAVDDAFNITSKSIVISNIDREAPEVKLLTDTSEWTANNVTVTVEADDNLSVQTDSTGHVTAYSGSGIKYIKYPGKDWAETTGGSFEISTNGDYEVRVKDGVGNETVKTISIKNIDKTAPKVSADLSHSDWTKNAVDVNLSFSDADSGIAEKQYAITNSSDTLPSAWNTYNGTITIDSDGEYYIHYRAVDRAGNDPVISSFGPYKIDHSGPTFPDITLLKADGSAYEQGQWANQNVSFSLSASGDALSGGVRYQYSLDGGNSWTEADSAEISIDGIHLIQYRALDVLDNCQGVKIAEIKIDKTEPEVSTENTDYKWKNHAIKVGLDFNDGHSGIVEKKYCISSSTEAAAWSDYSGEITINDDGESYIHYKAVDKAGNLLINYFGPYKKDTAEPTSPQIEFKNTGDESLYTLGEWTNQDVKLSLSGASDSLSGGIVYEYSKDGGENWTQGSSALISDEGLTELSCRTKDAAGNPSKIVAGLKVKVDKTSPQISLNGEAEMNIEALSKYEDQGAAASDKYDTGVTGKIEVENPVDTTKLGDYIVKYNLSDQAGNQAAQVIRTVHVLDTGKPVISLKGKSELTIERLDEYSDEGASAWDEYEKDISAEITVDNPVNSSVSGDYQVRYNVSDQSANAADEVIRIVHVVDTSRPQLSASSPADADTAVKIDTKIKVTFDEAVQAGDEIGQITLIQGDVESELNYSIEDRTLIISPNEDLIHDCRYTVNIPAAAIKDMSGNELASAYSFYFNSISNNSRLAGLELSKGALQPVFLSDTHQYKVNVFHGVKTITISPQTEDEKARVQINGIAVESGTASPEIELAVGGNQIEILLTAEDGSKSSYIIRVIRNKDHSPKNEAPSSAGGDTDGAKTEDDQAVEKSLEETGRAQISVEDDKEGRAEISSDTLKKLAEDEQVLLLDNSGVRVEFDSKSLADQQSGEDSTLEVKTKLIDGTSQNKLLEQVEKENPGLSAAGGAMLDLSAQVLGNDKKTLSSIDHFAEPTAVTIDLSDSRLSDEEIAKLTGVRYDIDEAGNISPVKMGGNYDPYNKSFTFYTDKPGQFGLAKAEQLLTIELTINKKPARINKVKVMNDVEPSIMNDRTMVPIRFVAENLGAEVDWIEESRTVVIELDGETLTMLIDQPVEGFDTAPTIKNNRTLVPIRYVSEKLGAYVMWFPSREEVYISK